MGPPSTPRTDWEISTSIPAIERWSLKSRKVASLQRDSPYCMLRDSQRICHVVSHSIVLDPDRFSVRVPRTESY
jgi:hypothetical protein